MPSFVSVKGSFDASVELQRSQLEQSFAWADSPEFISVGVNVPFVLLPYQQRWIEDESRIKVWEKSRRVGASWTEACLSVLEASKHNGRNTIYVSYNFDMTEGFIRDCEFWASRFNMAAKVCKEEILNEDKDILGYRIRFSSGKTIRALTGKPKNIRGKQSRVVIDEAAFCDDLGELLKAAIALLIWGGQVSIISTHNGTDNEFNTLLKDIKAGDRKYSLHRDTLDDALADGLYERICLIQGEEYSKDKEEKWRSELMFDYGVAAEEELLCEPYEAVAGKVFQRGWFEIVEPEYLKLQTQARGVDWEEMRFWDFAATEQSLKGPDPCATAGVKIRRVGTGDSAIYYIMDDIEVFESPGQANATVFNTATQDGKWCKVRWETEPGSSGIRDGYTLMNMLRGFDALGMTPDANKVMRAKPLATAAFQGRVKLVRGDWNAAFLNAATTFPDNKAGRDSIDSASGAFGALSGAKGVYRETKIKWGTA